MRNKFSVLTLALCSSLFFGQTKKNAEISELYQNYIAIKNNLSSDNAVKTAISSSEFLKTVSAIDKNTLSAASLSQLKENAKSMSTSKDIKVQRAKFESISNQMIGIAKKYKLADKPIYLQFCPMADAGWLSNESTIVNPYYGSSMLNCGKVQKEIK